MVGQVLGRTRYQTDGLTVFVVQHVRHYHGQRGVFPRRVRIDGGSRHESQRNQIVRVHHQFLLLRHLQVILKSVLKNHSFEEKKKQHVALWCLCGRAGRRGRAHVGRHPCTSPPRGIFYFEVLEVVDLFVSLGDQRLDGRPAQTVLEHYEQNGEREHGHEAKQHVPGSHPQVL